MIFARLLAMAGFLSWLLLIFHGDIYWVIGSLIYYKLIVGLLGNQIAQHRYFSHNSFATTRIKKYFLYFVSLTTGVNPRDYALIHRHHHIYSDKAGDVHSYHNKFGDIFFPLTGITSANSAIRVGRVLDNDLKGFYKYHQVTIISALLVASVVNWKIAVYLMLAGIAWNYIHMVLFRVWLVHAKLPGSYQNFETGDNSWNNKLIQFLDIGEGLHNNHHHKPNEYNQAMSLGEFDPAGWVVRKFFAL